MICIEPLRGIVMKNGGSREADEREQQSEGGPK